MLHEELPAYFRRLLPEDFPTVEEEIFWEWLPRDVFVDGDSRIGIGDRFRLAPLCPTGGIPVHKNDHFKLIYVYSGVLTLEFDTVRHVNEEQAILIPPGIPFKIHPCRRQDMAVQLSFQPALLSEQVGMEDLSAFFAGNVLMFDTNRSPMVRWYLDEMCCEHFDPDRHTYMMIPALFTLLLAALDRCVEVSRQERIRANTITVDEIQRYIKTNYNVASLQSTAKRFGFSPNYLSHMLKSATGMGFQELKQRAAVAQSAQLLLETDLTVAQIARNVGIRNITHFYGLFSARYGQTPAQYRQQHRKERVCNSYI